MIDSFLKDGIFGKTFKKAIFLWLQNQSVDFVLVNRKLDVDHTDGTILIEKMQKDSKLRQIPIMLISNYQESQEEAVGLGAVRGFGKLFR